MQSFSHRVANEGWCLEINGVLWAVRARIGAGRFPYILWDHIRAYRVPITWIRWYFIAKSSSTQASFDGKIKQAKTQKEQRFPKQRVQIRLSSSSRSLLHEKRREVPRAHAIPVSEALMKWGSQSASFPRGRRGNPPTRAHPLHGLPKASQIDAHGKRKAPSVLTYKRGFSVSVTRNLKPFSFHVPRHFSPTNEMSNSSSWQSISYSQGPRHLWTYYILLHKTHLKINLSKL